MRDQLPSGGSPPYTSDVSGAVLYSQYRSESARLSELLDSPCEQVFDRLTLLASRLLKSPIALVCLVDRHRLLFKSQVGLPEPWATRRETPLSHSLCQYVVINREPLVVEDARENVLLSKNESARDLGVIAYLGIPLVMSNGECLGSFCTIDTKPHLWTSEEISTLKILAESVISEIELRQEIARRIEVEYSLRQAKEAAEAATIAKGRFLANMSHEIRTPMNGMLGMAELALASSPAPELCEYLNVIQSSGRSLLLIINEILDYSKVEAGNFAFERVEFSLDGVLNAPLKALSVGAYSRGIELLARIAPEVPGHVIGDHGRLVQILINLVGNALKFTATGHVIVSVDLSQEASAPGRVRLAFSVEDTGIGIPEAKQVAIFEPFTQADTSTTRVFGGTGLGLSIAAILVDLMGGKISVSSTVGVGTTFRFDADFELPTEDKPVRPGFDGDGLALILDPDPPSRAYLVGLLTDWGFQVEAPENPTAIPPGGGPWAIALIDERLRIEGLPRDFVHIPMVPGNFSGSHALPMIRRPIIRGELALAIEHALRTEAAPQRRLTAPGVSKSVMGLQILVAEDHPVNQKIARAFLQRLGHEPHVVANGQAALELLQSKTFALAIIDIQMPVMDGFEFVRALRLRESVCTHPFHRLPVLALTAHAMEDDRRLCLESGFDGYLSKPMRLSDLDQAISTLLSQVDPSPETLTPHSASLTLTP